MVKLFNKNFDKFLHSGAFQRMEIQNFIQPHGEIISTKIKINSFILKYFKGWIFQNFLQSWWMTKMCWNSFILGHFKGWIFKLTAVDVFSVLFIITDPQDPHSGLLILCCRQNLSGKIVYFSELCLEKLYSFQATMSGFAWKNAAIKPVGTR